LSYEVSRIDPELNKFVSVVRSSSSLLGLQCFDTVGWAAGRVSGL